MLWNFYSQERKCRGTFTPNSENVVELSLPATSIEESNRPQLGLRSLLLSCSNFDRRSNLHVCAHVGLHIELGNNKNIFYD